MLSRSPPCVWRPSMQLKGSWSDRKTSPRVPGRQPEEDLNAQLLYGTVMLRERKRPEAAAAAAAAIALDGNSARAHLLAGDVHSQWDRTEDAIGEFEKVLALDTRALGAALQLVASASAGQPLQTRH